MIIQKFLHSCLLLEKDGRRLLIDPGSFCFVEGRVKPEDIGAVDAILISHQHQDHFDPVALKKFVAFGPTQIVTIQEIGELLQKEGLPHEPIGFGETKSIAGFSVRALEAAHGALPIEIPHNAAYVIDEALIHPGDSYELRDLSCDTLALPIAGPWARLVDAVAVVERVKPKRVIPIHDIIIKDFMLERMYGMLSTRLEKLNVEFRPLGLGEACNA
ncbi:MBL fold metallo-hydrolase [Candidatus Uhrbacteria bacterium]|nr:MBL fold metallo-hydrolase [Candidatus Uhrbacteria bacterium]